MTDVLCVCGEVERDGGGGMSAHVAFMCMDACHSVVRSVGLACLVAYDFHCL